MEIPFLKNKNKNAGGGAPIERVAAPTHENDMSNDDMMDHVASEFIQAIETKNHKLLREALSALVAHIQSEDEQQDEAMSE